MSTETDPNRSKRPLATGISTPDPAVQYRPVSVLAVVALALSLLTPLAFAHPYFWILPPVAFVTSVLVSRGLERVKEAYAGQLLAKMAIVLSLLTGVGSITRYGIERAILTREARSIANEFLDDVLANQLKAAFALTLPPYRRANMERDYDQLIARNGDNLRQFLASPIVLQFAGAAAETQVTYLGVGFYGYERGFQVIGLDYRFTLSDKESYLVKVLARGGVAAGGEWQGRAWYVSSPVVKKL